jgi:predicted acylesterase/phospholipase RssA
MGNSQMPAAPFERIALSCSGGGYRAASFHLGSMSYLNHALFKNKPLLEHVKLLSTVSGGSITGAVYALQKQQGKTFDEIYHFLLEKLSNLDLLRSAIEKLNPDADWPNPYKSKNLINAFADQYDKAFCNGALMSEFNVMTSHLEAIVFNCTEFENAVNFRFKNPGFKHSGNFYNRISSLQLREIRLGDVMAASSCFPGGFEPMRWPNDFMHEHAPNLQAQVDENEVKGVNPLGIMDGGIYDNQGIDSILKYKENVDPPYFDLIILSDVTSPELKAYIPFKEKPKTGFRALTLKAVRNKIQGINTMVNLCLWLVLAAGVIVPFLFHLDNWIAGICWTLAALSILMITLKRWLLKRFKHLIFNFLLKIRTHIPAYYLKRLSYLNLDDLSVHRIEPLITNRINSLLTLLSSVFLKVVRRLNYNRVYEDEAFKYRRFSSLIKCLNRENLTPVNRSGPSAASSILTVQASSAKKTFFAGDYNRDIGTAIEAIVNEASAFGTTLWFTEQEQLDDVLKKLIATGEITMCYNLILYMEQLMFAPDNGYDNLDAATQLTIEGLYKQCIADWSLFKDNPMYLVNLRGINSPSM